MTHIDTTFMKRHVFRSKKSEDLYTWISGTWGYNHRIFESAKMLQENRLELAIQTFYDETGLDTIELLNDENQDLLCDILDQYIDGQNADIANNCFN